MLFPFWDTFWQTNTRRSFFGLVLFMFKLTPCWILKEENWRNWVERVSIWVYQSKVKWSEHWHEPQEDVRWDAKAIIIWVIPLWLQQGQCHAISYKIDKLCIPKTVRSTSLEAFCYYTHGFCVALIWGMVWNAKEQVRLQTVALTQRNASANTLGKY